MFLEDQEELILMLKEVLISRVAGRNNSHAHGSNVSRVARSTISRGGPPTIAAAKQESAKNGTVDLDLFQLHFCFPSGRAVWKRVSA